MNFQNVRHLPICLPIFEDKVRAWYKLIKQMKQIFVIAKYYTVNHNGNVSLTFKLQVLIKHPTCCACQCMCLAARKVSSNWIFLKGAFAFEENRLNPAQRSFLKHFQRLILINVIILFFYFFFRVVI